MVEMVVMVEKSVDGAFCVFVGDNRQSLSGFLPLITKVDVACYNVALSWCGEKP
jgi:hypothetical protein